MSDAFWVLLSGASRSCRRGGDSTRSIRHPEKVTRPRLVVLVQRFHTDAPGRSSLTLFLALRDNKYIHRSTRAFAFCGHA